MTRTRKQRLEWRAAELLAVVFGTAALVQAGDGQWGWAALDLLGGLGWLSAGGAVLVRHREEAAQ